MQINNNTFSSITGSIQPIRDLNGNIISITSSNENLNDVNQFTELTSIYNYYTSSYSRRIFNYDFTEFGVESDERMLSKLTVPSWGILISQSEYDYLLQTSASLSENVNQLHTVIFSLYENIRILETQINYLLNIISGETGSITGSGFPSEFNININYSNPNNINWIVNPKYRIENLIYEGQGNATQAITLLQDNEFWKFTIDDEQEILNNKIIKVNNSTLERIENRYYILGDDEDLIFSFNSSNTINVNILNPDEIQIGRFDFDYQNSNSNINFYRDLETLCEVYNNQSDINPAFTFNINTEISQIGVVPVPSFIEAYPIGFYKFKFNKLSALEIVVASETGSVFSYQFNSQGVGLLETEKIYMGKNYLGFLKIIKPLN